MQPDFDSTWNVESMAAYLAVAADLGADLVVFPENFPFGSDQNPIPSIGDASARLADLPCPEALAFIAGGIVREGATVRNAAFLTYLRRPSGTYFKQIPWGREFENSSPFPITPGDQAELFQWGNFACVPLICADVYSPDPSKRKQLFESVRKKGGRDGDLIVVSAYAGEPRGVKWRTNLIAWAEEFHSPVAFCNFAGRDTECGPPIIFGYGGSTVFKPGLRHRPHQPTAPGVYIHDL